MAEGIGSYDIVVLGGGSGGYACALRAAELGKRVALIEEDRVGGTCLHRGCIPTKALLHAAEIADHARDSASVGVKSTFEGIDVPGVQSYKDSVVDRLWKGLQSTIASRKIDTIEGSGRLESPTRVRVGDTVYEAEHVVLATGSQPKSLPGLDIDGERVITSDHALTLDRVPESVVILGGGVIGVEFASVWRSFGAEVTIVEMLPQLLPLEDETSAKLLQRAFRRRGIRFELGARFESVKHNDTGVTVSLEGGKTLDADLLLVAVGRGPVSADLGYEEAGVAIERGFVKVDSLCRTSIPSISAVGDLINTPQLAHVGFAEGIMVAERIGGLPVTPIDYDGVPRITYSDPEVASVGLTSAQAAERGLQTVEFNYNLGGNGRSVILQTQGAAKVIAISEAGRSRPRDRHPHRRQPRQRAHRGGSADLQLGRRALGRGPAHPPPSHPVGGDRRGASRAGRQAPARTRVGVTRIMSVSVSMPQLGESVTEGTVTRWLKKEGERVEADEPLLEVSTDKVDTEIPSPASGILRGITVDEDETVAVGAQLAVIDDGVSGDAAPAADDSAPAEAAAPAQPETAQPESRPGRGIAARGRPAGTGPGGELWRLEFAAQLRAARAILALGLAGVRGLTRAFGARLRPAACIRPAPVVPSLRPGRLGSSLRRAGPGQ